MSTLETVVDLSALENWIETAGIRIGVGDWRPAKSGTFGMFDLVGIEYLE